MRSNRRLLIEDIKPDLKATEEETERLISDPVENLRVMSRLKMQRKQKRNLRIISALIVIGLIYFFLVKGPTTTNTQKTNK